LGIDRKLMRAPLPHYQTLAEARRLLLAGNGEAALETLQPVLADDPEHLEARHLQLLCVYLRLFGATGLAVFNDQTKLHPKINEGHLRMAQTLLEGGADDFAAFAFRTAALLDYHLNPQLAEGFAGPFNGQVLRRACFNAIVLDKRLALIVETGTHRGTTTEYMARRSSCPIKTVENSPYYAEYSRVRFTNLARQGFNWAERVELHQGDSRGFLAAILAIPEADGDFSFFYLDAHGEYIFDSETPENPLVTEVDLVRRHRRHPIIMIDDFLVEDDPGYASEETCNALSDLAPILDQFDAWFLPISSEHDSGYFRGSIVLSGSPEATALLASISELRRGH
jgi:hypothetical protein